MSTDSVTLTGTLTAGPQGVCENGFPSGLLQMSFGLAGGCPGEGGKSAAANVHATRTINTPTTYTPLEGVGAGLTVEKAHTVYLRSQNSSFLVRATFADPDGGADLVSFIPMNGLLIIEPSPVGLLKAIAVKGAGKLEYFIGGNS